MPVNRSKNTWATRKPSNDRRVVFNHNGGVSGNVQLPPAWSDMKVVGKSATPLAPVAESTARAKTTAGLSNGRRQQPATTTLLRRGLTGGRARPLHNAAGRQSVKTAPAQVQQQQQQQQQQQTKQEDVEQNASHAKESTHQIRTAPAATEEQDKALGHQPVPNKRTRGQHHPRPIVLPCRNPEKYVARMKHDGRLDQIDRFRKAHNIGSVDDNLDETSPGNDRGNAAAGSTRKENATSQRPDLSHSAGQGLQAKKSGNRSHRSSAGSRQKQSTVQPEWGIDRAAWSKSQIVAFTSALAKQDYLFKRCGMTPYAAGVLGYPGIRIGNINRPEIEKTEYGHYKPPVDYRTKKEVRSDMAKFRNKLRGELNGYKEKRAKYPPLTWDEMMQELQVGSRKNYVYDGEISLPIQRKEKRTKLVYDPTGMAIPVTYDFQTCLTFDREVLRPKRDERNWYSGSAHPSDSDWEHVIQHAEEHYQAEGDDLVYAAERTETSGLLCIWFRVGTREQYVGPQEDWIYDIYIQDLTSSPLARVLRQIKPYICPNIVMNPLCKKAVFALQLGKEFPWLRPGDTFHERPLSLIIKGGMPDDQRKVLLQISLCLGAQHIWRLVYRDQQTSAERRNKWRQADEFPPNSEKTSGNTENTENVPDANEKNIVQQNASEENAMLDRAAAAGATPPVESTQLRTPPLLTESLLLAPAASGQHARSPAAYTGESAGTSMHRKSSLHDPVTGLLSSRRSRQHGHQRPLGRPSSGSRHATEPSNPEEFRMLMDSMRKDILPQAKPPTSS